MAEHLTQYVSLQGGKKPKKRKEFVQLCMCNGFDGRKLII